MAITLEQFIEGLARGAATASSRSRTLVEACAEIEARFNGGPEDRAELIAEALDDEDFPASHTDNPEEDEKVASMMLAVLGDPSAAANPLDAMAVLARQFVRMLAPAAPAAKDRIEVMSEVIDELDAALAPTIRRVDALEADVHHNATVTDASIEDTDACLADTDAHLAKAVARIDALDAHLTGVLAKVGQLDIDVSALSEYTTAVNKGVNQLEDRVGRFAAETALQFKGLAAIRMRERVAKLEAMLRVILPAFEAAKLRPDPAVKDALARESGLLDVEGYLKPSEPKATHPPLSGREILPGEVNTIERAERCLALPPSDPRKKEARDFILRYYASSEAVG